MPVKLRPLHAAMPGDLQPSKKMLLVALSGITSFMFVLIVLLIVFYFDNTIRDSEDLELKTQLGVIGHLNDVPNLTITGKKKGGNYSNVKDIEIFRDLLRSIRFEIDTQLKEDKILAITSLDGGEGKTLVSFSLAYAYAMTNKKVLLIDGNFTRPVISNTLKSNDYLEDYFSSDDFKKPKAVTPEPAKIMNSNSLALLEFNNQTSISYTLQQLQTDSTGINQGPLSILSNKGRNVSLLEITNPGNIKSKLEELKQQFDIIIIEAGSLSTFNKSKEWIMFADKVLTVFASNQSLKDSDKRNIKYLRELNGKMLGWIFNRLPVNYTASTQV
ncbi:MAG: hypothetical protein EOO43_02245 [Flavobacterium sp.]|nr:MAG: hypothetical protein EOO43_02245 [Flavobacterium sp.]